MIKAAAYLIALLALLATPTATTADAAAVQQTRLLAGKPRQLAGASWFGGT